MLCGENPSGTVCASAKALAKLAAFMANKGTLKINNEDYQLISEHTWWLMHSDPKPECEPIW